MLTILLLLSGLLINRFVHIIYTFAWCWILLLLVLVCYVCLCPFGLSSQGGGAMPRTTWGSSTSRSDSPIFKNRFNQVPSVTEYPLIKRIRTDTTIDLSKILPRRVTWRRAIIFWYICDRTKSLWMLLFLKISMKGTGREFYSLMILSNEQLVRISLELS